MSALRRVREMLPGRRTAGRAPDSAVAAISGLVAAFAHAAQDEDRRDAEDREHEERNRGTQRNVVALTPQGTIRMPSHLRWPLAGRLWTKLETKKPIKALKKTALTAKMHDCLTTIKKVLRLNRKRKLSMPTKRTIDLLSVARWTE